MIKTIPVNGPGAGSDAGDRRRWAGKKKVRNVGPRKEARAEARRKTLGERLQFGQPVRLERHAQERPA